MALTATATQGFEPAGKTSGDEIFYLPGDPGVTYTRGDMVTINVGEGVLTAAVTADAYPLGTVMKTTVCPAATQAFPKPGDFDPVYNNAEDKTLVPIRVHVPAGIQVYHATFAGQDDETVVSYTESTRAVAFTTGMAADDYPNGALVYVYEGPGAGECNVVEDYDHTGGAAELLGIMHRPFDATLTTSSKMIVLAGEAVASRGIHIMGGIDIADQNNLTVAQGADDGEFVVFCDWYRLGDHLKNLRLPVIPRSALLG